MWFSIFSMKTKLLCNSTSKCIFVHAFTWSKMMKMAWKSSKNYSFYHVYDNTNISVCETLLSMTKMGHIITMQSLHDEKHTFWWFLLFLLFLTIANASKCFLFVDLNKVLLGIVITQVKGHEPKSYEMLELLLFFSYFLQL